MATVDLQSLLSGLPPDVQAMAGAQLSGVPDAAAGYVTQALGIGSAQLGGIVSDLGPALSLIQTLGAGGQPSPTQTLAAMAGIASIANPLAGAAIMGMGALMAGATEAVNDMFRALGLQHAAPVPKAVVGVLGIGLDVIPSGPSDPRWLTWAELVAPSNRGGAAFRGLPRFLAQPAIYALQGSPTASDAAPMTKLMAAVAGKNTWGTWHAPDNQPDLSAPRNDFERFFAEILKRDLEYWANAQGYARPRDLLTGAASAWNSSHRSAGPSHAVQGKVSFITTTTLIVGDITYAPSRDSLPAYVLSSDTDPTGNLVDGAAVGPVYLGSMLQRMAPPGTVEHAATPPADPRALAAAHAALTALRSSSAPRPSSPASSRRTLLTLGALAAGAIVLSHAKG